MTATSRGTKGKSASAPLKVLSLFSGCGGMDLGFEGGFRVLARSLNPAVHPEWLDDAVGEGDWITLPRNRFETVFANDIFPAARNAWIPYFTGKRGGGGEFHLASVVDLVKSGLEGKKIFPKVDVVTGGFPCQDFSLAGKRRGFNSHKAHHGDLLLDSDNPSEENRGKLYMWMRNVIELVLPKVFVAENVKGLASLADTKQIIEDDFRSVGPGYLVVEARLLRAPAYGVPQNRERIIFIGFRRDAITAAAASALAMEIVPAEFDPYPPPTHLTPKENPVSGDPRLPFVSVGECLADLPEPENSDDPAQQAFSNAKWMGTHCQGQIEVKLERIAPTIRSEHHGNIEFRRLSREHGGKHESELRANLPERRLSVRECARIQTFPDDFEFVRPRAGADGFGINPTDAYKVVGNAVPPLLAFHVARRLQDLWPRLFRR